MRLLTLARDLRRRKARERDGRFVAEGVRVVEELMRSPLRVEGLLVAPKMVDSPRAAAIIAAARERGVAVTDVDDREFRSAAETESPQGILAVANVPLHAIGEFARPGSLRLVVLDAVQDPGNVGTIIRTAAALGAHGTVALPGTVDVWNAKVVRSAMGTHFVHPVLHASLEELVSFLGGAAVELWAADAGGESLPATAPDRLALVVGNEGSGISPAVREAAARVVALPIAPIVESLNVAVATGIMLYQLQP